MSTLSPMTHPPQPSQAAARRRRTNTVTIVVGLAVLGVVLGLAAIGAAMSSSSDKDAQGTTAAAASESPAAAAAVDAGIPPAPDAATTTAYITALKKIDPAIVGDKDPKTIVNRGRDQCGSIKEHPDDEQRLVDLTNKRFTAPGHPNGFGEVKAKKILAAVRTHICPTY
ncbi:hypothetical protein [Phytohabitans aurantiacus]|uniref:DUF732 domain-containing protein n=1 Tax=Phytohabitans aurantiacus TaxID=3016789 RepID=A0ABQ5QK16_9ACTN|nr:hypothetical protein [Phytohabitans aurantiacus]GLH94886.1 hypothetical protein Pa4123_01580 [Phytohabitans aurantiacus]